VALLEVVHDERIRLANVVRETVTDRHAEDLRELARESRQGPHGFHRAKSWVVVRDLPRRIVLQNRIQLHHVGVVFRELVGGSIATNDDVLRHGSTSLHRSVSSSGKLSKCFVNSTTAFCSAAVARFSYFGSTN